MSRYHTKRQIGFGAAVCLLLLVGADRAWTADRYLIGPASLQASPSIPKTVVDGVNPQGWVLYTQSYGVKEQICEIFLAKTLTVRSAAPKSSNLLYSGLTEGAMVGVIHLLPEATEDYSADSHNQTLRPGYYTMRYAVMPAGTYENGTKPGDFVVLSPASKDQDPSRILKTAELTRLGEATSGTDVPATMALVAPDPGSRQFPSVKVDETDMCIVQVQLRLAATKGAAAAASEFPLAIGLVTPIHGPEGS